MRKQQRRRPPTIITFRFDDDSVVSLVVESLLPDPPLPETPSLEMLHVVFTFCSEDSLTFRVTPCMQIWDVQSAAFSVLPWYAKLLAH